MSNKYPSTTGYAITTRKDWNTDTGEISEITVTGDQSEVSTLYENAKSESGVVAAQLQIGRGRGTATKRYERLVAGETPSPGVTQELYAIDIVKEIRAHPYFAALTNAEILAVKTAADAGAAAGGSWSALQNTLYKHYAFGMESYYETGFIFRSTRRVSGDSALSISTSDINKVVTAPTASGAMANLLASLPAGEWLKRPPSIRLIRPGVWEASEEWQWAAAWSVVYGGTFGATTT